MNENIKKLAVRARLSWVMQTDFDRVNLQEFADLIIQEACQHLTDVGSDHAREQLEKHFGIKE